MQPFVCQISEPGRREYRWSCRPRRPETRTCSSLSQTGPSESLYKQAQEPCRPRSRAGRQKPVAKCAKCSRRRGGASRDAGRPPRTLAAVEALAGPLRPALPRHGGGAPDVGDRRPRRPLRGLAVHRHGHHGRRPPWGVRGRGSLGWRSRRARQRTRQRHDGAWGPFARMLQDGRMLLLPFSLFACKVASTCL